MANWPCEASIDPLNMMNRGSLHPRWAKVAVRSVPVWEGYREHHRDGAPAFGRCNGQGAGVGCFTSVAVSKSTLATVTFAGMAPVRAIELVTGVRVVS